MTHILVTNDYPPKIGGIQSYLFELWRRLDQESFSVLTTAQADAAAFDATAGHHIVRLPKRMLLPTPALGRAIRDLARARGASLVVLDPALPLGWIGLHLDMPYAVVLHGAEVTIPARLPFLRRSLRKVISSAALVIAAGDYPASEARRLCGSSLPPIACIPPGVDSARFRPLSFDERRAVRERLGIGADAPVIFSVSRLVPRKGMDVLIEAAAQLQDELPGLSVLIGGKGRDEKRLMKLANRLKAPVGFLGGISDDDLPFFYGAADVFAMLCRTRWLGLEQEGFGIVFLEAAATGVAQVAGRSGGAYDAVLDGETGKVADRPGDVVVATQALRSLLIDDDLRARLGHRSLERARSEFSYDTLAENLSLALATAGG